MSKLAKGDRAPDFTLFDQDGSPVSLSDFKGDRLLLYFYPRANTPGCTQQSCSVSESRVELRAKGIEAVGISPDAPAAQKKFDEKHSLGFPLLSDPDYAVAKAYGAFGVKNMYGKKKEGIVRSSFLIDGQLNVVEAWYKVKPDATVPNALEASD